MSVNSLDELFLHELKDLLDAENQLVEALPKMARAATDPQLKEAFQSHLDETKTHVTRLKEVFQELGGSPERETCDGMKGLLEEGDKLKEEIEEDSVLNAGLIAAAQKVEHYEIATYGTLITWARTAGLDTVVQLLEQTLEEEKAADEKLTEIAESGVNASAAAGSEEESEEETAGAGRSASGKSSSKGAGKARSAAPARSNRARK